MTPNMKRGQLKREEFVAHFLECGDAVESCRRMGYSENVCCTRSGELMRHPEVKSAIDAHRLAAVKRAELSLDSVIAELARIAFAPFGDKFVKTREKRAALESLVRHFGGFTDRIHVSGDINVRHAYEFSDDELAALAAGRALEVGGVDPARSQASH